MAVDKLMSKNISDLSKIMGIDKDNLSKFMGADLLISGTTNSFYSASDQDDGHCSGTEFVPDWDVDIIGNYLSLPVDLYFRFINVQIPQGATITDAVVRFTSGSNKTSTVIRTNLTFGDVDDASQPNSCNDMAAVLRTSNVAWNNIDSWVTGVQYDTPQLKDIFQTVVDRAGWSSGNAAILLIDDSGSDNEARRNISMYNYLSGAEKPELWVTWIP